MKFRCSGEQIGGYAWTYLYLDIKRSLLKTSFECCKRFGNMNMPLVMGIRELIRLSATILVHV